MRTDALNRNSFSLFLSLSIYLSFSLSLSLCLSAFPRLSYTSGCSSTPFELGNYRLTTHQVNPLPTHSNLLMKFSPLTDWLAWLGSARWLPSWLADGRDDSGVPRERRRDREIGEKGKGYASLSLCFSPSSPPTLLSSHSRVPALGYSEGKTEISRAPKWLKASLPFFTASLTA